MIVPAPLAFPGGRALAAWWRQLAPGKPRSIWVGHLFLHRVNAMARLTRSVRPDALHALILKAISLNPDEPLERLDQRLHMGHQVLGRVQRSLIDAGLVRFESGHPVPTPTGQDALARGEYQAAVQERRVFYFVEPDPGAGVPFFLPLDDPPTIGLSAGNDWRFDGRWLVECVTRPAEWKRRFGFPLEVEEVILGLDGSVAPGALEPWQRVILDRPERIPVAMTLTTFPEGGDRLQAFAVRQDTWTLLADAPLFSLPDGWADAFPSLLQGPSAAEWEEAWRAWCQPRGLAAGDAGAMQPEGHRLRVKVLPRLLERLRTARSDALQGEAWLLAGSGRLRAAAQIEIVENEPRPALRQA